MPLIASEFTLEYLWTESNEVQTDPLSVDRKTPLSPPSKMSVPFTTRALTSVVVKPELISVQVEPLSFERNTPPPAVPAKRLVSTTSKASTS